MRTAKHGTDSGYYRHLLTPSPDWPRDACAACLAAHYQAMREQQQARRRARQLTRAARVRCPDCGGAKSATAKRCKACAAKQPRLTRIEHGSDSGYYKHIRQTGTITPDWTRLACDACRAAHSEAERQRKASATRKPRARRAAQPPRYRLCVDCGKRISATAQRCRACARKHHVLIANIEPPSRWVRVGLIWKAAS